MIRIACLITCFIIAGFMISCNTNENKKDNLTQKDSIAGAGIQKAEEAVKPDGVEEIFYPNGKTKTIGEYKDGKRTGEWLAWYENGVPWSQAHFENGLKNGESIVYYPNGQKRYIGYYNNDEKTGVWKFFDEQGKLIKTEDFTKK